MAWLNGVLAELNFIIVVLVFYGVGLFMFLLPPVPGLPVYLSGGIILGKQGVNNGWSFGASLAFACGVCFSIKLIAILMQQMVIGQTMSGSLKVRQLVGVNSISIRAIRKILDRPGMSFAQTFVLIGAPDWPVSVLTGILRLSPLKMQLGSLPVFFLVVPMTLAGGFLLRENDPGLWSSCLLYTSPSPRDRG